MQQGQGVFYDGISANPHKALLVLDELRETLEFGLDGYSNITWHLHELEVEKLGQSLSIKSKHYPLQSIITADADFIQAFQQLRKVKGHISAYHRLIALGAGAHLLIALGILGLIALVYIYLMPYVAEKAVVLIPESYENSMGNNFFEQYVSYQTVDSAKTKVLTEFASQLDLQNTKPIKFTVVESETVNAFALPDGNVVVFTGIVDQMKSYHELAGLIGHEVSHVNQRHSMKMLCRNLSGYIFLSTVLSDVNGIMAVIGDNLHTLQSLTYSRRFEHEADEKGLEMLLRNNINPKGMADLFSHLKSKDENIVPEFLSSHPVTQDRIDFINNAIAKSTVSQKENETLKNLFLKLKN